MAGVGFEKAAGRGDDLSAEKFGVTAGDGAVASGIGVGVIGAGDGGAVTQPVIIFDNETGTGTEKFGHQIDRTLPLFK